MKAKGAALEADLVVQSVKRCLSQGVHGLETLPSLLRRVVHENLWRERRLERTGDVVRFAKFRDFVEAPRPEGLGSELAVLAAVCRDDPELLDVLDRAAREAPTLEESASAHSRRASGNARVAAIRRLRDARPDLHKKVVKGTVSPHEAMRQAGFRRRTMSVPTTVPEMARTLERRLTKREIAKLVNELSGDGHSNGHDRGTRSPNGRAGKRHR